MTSMIEDKPSPMIAARPDLEGFAPAAPPPATITVAFGVDAAYVPHLAATIASVRAASPGAAFHFLVVHEGIEADARVRVERIAPTDRFTWARVEDPELLAMTGDGHISRATFFRLALPRIAPADAPRALYLDSDLIVARDVSSLWRTDLHGAPIGAVCDSGMDWKPFALANDLPVAQGPYFNAGVLLIDLDRIRREGTFDRAIDVLRGRRLQYMDQDALNIVAWGRWRPLDAIWNVQHTMLLGGAAPDVPRAMLPAPDATPGIVHFTGRNKPWLVDGYHPYGWLYWRALKRTDFYAEVMRDHGVGRLAQARVWARYLAHWPKRLSR
ncbi:MAG: glycosyltransferase family 8 protein [Alphaproteobacteria bacterium]|nr:glycosyltransferase family 8 protein [Alphaproteobacteria bacterium]